MPTIQDIISAYHNKLDSLDLELIIAHALNRTREFVLAHPEHKLSGKQENKLKGYIRRRVNYKPLAYILGYKEFYGMDFKVNKNVLIPRPETEMLVKEVIGNLRAKAKNKKTVIIDVGTGSGNIIIAIARNLKSKISNFKLFGTDISKKALAIAKQNAQKHKVNKKIKFLQGNLLKPVFQNFPPKTRLVGAMAKRADQPLAEKFKIQNLIIVANLPYLSKKIYSSVSFEIKNYEPRSALLSGQGGLSHYKKLFQQIKKLRTANCEPLVFLELSPEQKPRIKELIRKYFPREKAVFKKDLAGKWRLAVIRIS